MSSQSFRAYVVREQSDGSFIGAVETRAIDDLPDGEVLVRVSHSSVNYKDALSASGNRGVTRAYPHTPGIDAAGVVAASRSPAWREGDAVIVMGFDLGMNTSGGWGEYIRVPADWVMARPAALSPELCMAYGTAGATAGLSVMALIAHGLRPDEGPVLVTGASGGVGIVALRLLKRAGFHAIAATGKPHVAERLRVAGAEEVVDVATIGGDEDRPLLPRRWAGAVDTVGGDMLTAALRATDARGVVTTCGNAGGARLHMTVYPFILRGISLVGIAAADCPMTDRVPLWEHLANDWRLDELLADSRDCTLDDVGAVVDQLLGREHCGRSIITH